MCIRDSSYIPVTLESGPSTDCEISPYNIVVHTIRKHRRILVEQIRHAAEQRDARILIVAEHQGILEAEIDIRPALDVGAQGCPAIGVARRLLSLIHIS